MKGNRSRRVKLGLIGCGNVAENRHLPALQSLKESKVVAVADIRPDRLKRVVEKFHIEKSYIDYRFLLSDPEVEAVAVCVPPHSHVEVALAALEAQKHVLIEKPLALSLDEADHLIKQAEQSPCKVMVNFNLRWHRLVRQTQEIIRQGKLGPLELAFSAFTSETRFRQNVPEWKTQRQKGGGVLIENAVHYFDLWRFLFQNEVEEVFAVSKSEPWDDVTAIVTAQMTNGLPVNALFSVATSVNKEIQIHGQAGSLHVSLYRFDGLEFTSLSSFPGNVLTRLRTVKQFLKELPRAISHVNQRGDFNASYRGMWHHFIDAIQHDKPVESTLEDGRCALQVVLAAVASASLGHPVKVAQAPRKITPVVWK